MHTLNKDYMIYHTVVCLEPCLLAVRHIMPVSIFHDSLPGRYSKDH